MRELPKYAFDIVSYVRELAINLWPTVMRETCMKYHFLSSDIKLTLSLLCCVTTSPEVVGWGYEAPLLPIRPTYYAL